MVIRHVKIDNFRGIKSLDWHPKDGLVCIIGRGDSCKSTFLDALETCLSPSRSKSPDDLDFFNIDPNEPVSIQVTIGGFEDSSEISRAFLSESSYGLYARGYLNGSIVSEPTDCAEPVLTIEYSLDSDMEPSWNVIAPGRLDPKPIRRAHLAMLGVVKLGTYSDWHFSWSRNSMIAQLGGAVSVDSRLSAIGRELREENLQLQELEEQANNIETLVRKFGIKTNGYSPKLDVQSLILKSGGISLHDGKIPIKRYGIGTKRLVALALQEKIHENKSVRLIDEFEYGLEPYRIVTAINKIIKDGNQSFISTHSPVVIRECEAEQVVVLHNNSGHIRPVQLVDGLNSDEISSLQGVLRTHAEAFLSEKIIVCEGQTEFGLMRSLSAYRLRNGMPSFSSTGTSALCANGIKQCAPIAKQLRAAGYKVAIFCDADVPLSIESAELKQNEIDVFTWTASRFTEQAIYEDLSEGIVSRAIKLAIENVGEGTVLSSLGQQHISNIDLTCVNDWDWGDEKFRQQIALASSKGSWHKRISYGKDLGDIIFANKLDVDRQTEFCKVMEKIAKWYE